MIAFAQTPGRAAATAGATRTTPFVSVKKKRSAAAASTTLSSAVPTAEEEEEAREECVLVKSQIKLCEDAVHDDGKEHTVLEIMAATHLGKRVNTCSFVHGASRARPPTYSRPTKDIRLTTPTHLTHTDAEEPPQIEHVGMYTELHWNGSTSGSWRTPISHRDHNAVVQCRAEGGGVGPPTLFYNTTSY